MQIFLTLLAHFPRTKFIYHSNEVGGDGAQEFWDVL